MSYYILERAGIYRNKKKSPNSWWSWWRININGTKNKNTNHSDDIFVRWNMLFIVWYNVLGHKVSCLTYDGYENERK